MAFESDLFGSGSLQNAVENLTGVLGEGARVSELPIAANGRVSVPEGFRRPMIALELRDDRPDEALIVFITNGTTATSPRLPRIRFSPLTEAGAMMPAHVPPVSAGSQTNSAFVLQLGAERVNAQGVSTPVLRPALAGLLRAVVVEGHLGKLLYALNAEKARIRRQARELQQIRTLDGAKLDALDRIASEVGLRRFEDVLEYDSAREEILARRTAGSLESDDDFRRRLSLYRSWMIPTRGYLEERLNGPGAPGDPNAGPLGELGLTDRLSLFDRANPFGFAVHLVTVGDAPQRTRFMNALQRDRLLLPRANADPVHASRMENADTKAVIQTLRTRLRAQYAFADGDAVTPMLGSALDRLARCMSALGQNGPFAVPRTNRNGVGSRYELSLGLDLGGFTAAFLTTVRGAAQTVNLANVADLEVRRILADARASGIPDTAADPSGAWLLERCGLQTRHRLDNATLYVSHLPIQGMIVTGPNHVARGANITLQAEWRGTFDGAEHSGVEESHAKALAAWTAAGRAGWTKIAPANAPATWTRARTWTANSQVMRCFAAGGFNQVVDPRVAIDRLTAGPQNMLCTVVLEANQTENVLKNTALGRDLLRDLKAVFVRAGFCAVLPMAANNQIIFVLALQPLPEVGLNLAERRTAGFRWYSVALGANLGNGADLRQRTGQSVQVHGEANGIYALVALGYRRLDGADPYEFRVEAPANASLNLEQYEFLMNLLEHSCPIGVEANTFPIRNRSVSLQAGQPPTPLKPSAARTYRRFRMRRNRDMYVHDFSTE
jgi:hypothetical protein